MANEREMAPRAPTNVKLCREWDTGDFQSRSQSRHKGSADVGDLRTDTAWSVQGRDARGCFRKTETGSVWPTMARVWAQRRKGTIRDILRAATRLERKARALAAVAEGMRP